MRGAPSIGSAFLLKNYLYGNLTHQKLASSGDFRLQCDVNFGILPAPSPSWEPTHA